jgi:hypothetical protein
MDETRKHIKWNKPGSETQISHVFYYKQSLHIRKRHERRRVTTWEEEEDQWEGGVQIKEGSRWVEWIWLKFIVYIYKNVMMKPIILYN